VGEDALVGSGGLLFRHDLLPLLVELGVLGLERLALGFELLIGDIDLLGVLQDLAILLDDRFFESDLVVERLTSSSPWSP
jgi:hypothetical protein